MSSPTIGRIATVQSGQERHLRQWVASHRPEREDVVVAAVTVMCIPLALILAAWVGIVLIAVIVAMV